MKNGLYAVAFAVGGSMGNGVITLQDGRASGGDSGFAFVGNIDQSGEDVTGSFHVFQHSVGMENVFAGLTDFVLDVQGRETANSSASLHGTTSSAPGAQLQVSMRFLQEV
ncbi:GrlR family regulatory protein [Sphingomonas sp. GB1N7]|uniref:GrlR family regulatory protein n=1 Tax=Parasphingomonas caseinilytica TaxID=3096158 RepID=UPI002FC74DD0